ncbi:MAG: UDP-galactopyranose mutase [Actinomycetota bacterium]|nr:UDP-galactopyranose mutase [Actinomycetota bacterium]
MTDSSAWDVVCFSHLRWGFVFQRPQHLLSRCARSRRVFFIEEPVHGTATELDVRHWGEGLWTVVPVLPASFDDGEAEEAQRALLGELFADHGIQEYVLWYYTPMAVPLGRSLRPLATIYDCMDELSAFHGAPTTLREREGELFDSADLVFTGGRSLYEAKHHRHQAVHLFPSSVDRDHFAQARTIVEDPPDQALLPRPRLGYFGVIDERFDRDLLAELAALRPSWQFPMIGPVLKVDRNQLPNAPNIHWLGERTYQELPSYLAGWDAALLPFARNEATRFVSPTKIPEYLAGGCPVVSTSIADVVEPYGRRGLVRIADDPKAFAAAAEAAFAEDPARRLESVDHFLEGNSWDATWARMGELIRDVIDRRAQRNGLAAESVPATAPDGIEVAYEPPPEPRGDSDAFDALIVGAGFAGSVLAERFAAAGRRVLVVERRDHIGGNAYDEYDDAGILIHRYGPHIFHTNSSEVFRYLSAFTEWRPYEHRVLASVEGRLLPIPINLDTINELYGMSMSSSELEQFFQGVAEPIERVRTSEDVVVARVGRELYEKFFRGYTRKQWGMDPSELDAKVTSRVPIRTNRDPRYFTDTYQAMPRDGYTRMFHRMLDHPGIKVLLNTDHREIAGLIPHRSLIFTGPIDEYFDYRFERLPYRSLDFRFETLDVPFAQPVPVINYPNEHEYTRVTEFKYLTGQEHQRTTRVYEYPQDEGDPYYPVPRAENEQRYQKYRELQRSRPDVHFVGRLATYRYYNMDQVVAQALSVAARLLRHERNLKGGADGVGASSRPAGIVGRDRVHP